MSGPRPEGGAIGALDLVERAVSRTDGTDREAIAAAVRSVSAEVVVDLLHGGGDVGQGELVASGTGVSPGVAGGVVATTIDAALDAADRGTDPVLVLDETRPSDEVGMRVAAAVVTRRGGPASHTAVLARELGVPAVVGCGEVRAVDGDEVWVDGGTGEVRRAGGRTLRSEPVVDELPEALATLLEWADELAAIEVWANADTAHSAERARRFGARAVGLCRMEHVLRGTPASRLDELLRSDASSGATHLGDLASAWADELDAVFRAMSGSAVTVRLLAPEGPGGASILVRRPDLLEAQADAITTAADRAAAAGTDPRPRILVPLVALPAEAAWMAERLADLAPGLPVGAMVETPRAALAADRIAAHVDFLAFGTNDLTRLTYGWSRDAAEGELLDAYRAAGLLDANPFETLDVGGVVRLLALAAETARGTHPGIGLSLCGEHAGDPRSIGIAAQLGIGAVSASPWRVPVARLAAAHSALEGVG